MTHDGLLNDAVELEQQYNLRRRHPNYETEISPAWAQRSTDFRGSANVLENIAYGPGERDRLDLFLTDDSSTKPLLIFIHGGYWQRGDKSDYSFLAQPFVDNNVSVALVNYDLCPSVEISDMPQQIQRAVVWIYRNATRLNLSPERLFIMGHSAGAHLAAMAMSTDWTSLDQTLPPTLLQGSVLLSGLYDLVPIVKTTVNDKIGMDAALAQSQSPVHLVPGVCHRHLIACGELESAQFHWQADTYHAALSKQGLTTRQFTVPDADHFTELNQLADENSDFFLTTLEWLKSGEAITQK